MIGGTVAQALAWTLHPLPLSPASAVHACNMVCALLFLPPPHFAILCTYHTHPMPAHTPIPLLPVSLPTSLTTCSLGLPL